MSFTATTHQNEYLPAGTGEVHAIVTVAADDSIVANTASGDRCIALVVDTSGSMSNPMEKIHSARRAVAEAVGQLPDGVRFCVIAGDHEAKLIYPRSGRDLAVADDRTRQEAVEAARRLQPSGGTAISTWLDLTREMMDGYTGIKLAYLLTDGKNESEPSAKLDEAIARCAGEFQCDARGVGDAWEVVAMWQVFQSASPDDQVALHLPGIESWWYYETDYFPRTWSYKLDFLRSLLDARQVQSNLVVR